MKIWRNSILALSLALLLALPALAVIAPAAYADDSTESTKNLPVKTEPLWRNTWYKFETPLVTLIFPAKGTKPMFLWWYTNDNSTIYTVKFKGVIEYLTIDKQFYVHRFRADNDTLNATLWKGGVDLELGRKYGHGQKYNQAVREFLDLLRGLHNAFLPFSACKWNLTGPELVEAENSSYWSFNFTLTEVHGHSRFEFAENNIQIRCRFYNTTTTEVPDETCSDYNYTVAAGQLKFDFVVSNWQWNIDKINQLLKNHGIDIPTNRTALALWINMASIKLEDLQCAENEVQYEAEHHVEAQVQVENKSQMREIMINGEHYAVDKDETAQDEKPIQATLRLRERFRERIRLNFTRVEKDVPVGFLEFVPWARLIDEDGGTADFVNVTASYIAAGGHLRLFICYPYFGNYTLEHDPTIGLTSAEQIIPEVTPGPIEPTPKPTLEPAPEPTPKPAPATSPTLGAPRLLMVLIGATVIIALAVAALKLLKKPINLLTVK